MQAVADAETDRVRHADRERSRDADLDRSGDADRERSRHVDLDRSRGADLDRSRDADRSRRAILDAAETLFAERGFESVSLQDIGDAAGLSRGTPGYHFGAKHDLYVTVLERVFADREDATKRAFEAVRAWCDSPRPGPLRGPLTRAIESYMSFLLARPAFVSLVVREELRGGEGLRLAQHEGAAMREALAAVRAVARTRSLRRFDVDDAVLVLVSLTFSPLSQRSTFMAALARDLTDPVVRARHVRLVVQLMLDLLGVPDSGS
jgi:TetR/AcrR family transcriptional regulator